MTASDSVTSPRQERLDRGLQVSDDDADRPQRIILNHTGLPEKELQHLGGGRRGKLLGAESIWVFIVFCVFCFVCFLLA